MKILFVSMPCIHFYRWVENLENTSDELYWFDVLGRGKIETIGKVHQITDWKKRKIPYMKGEYFLRKKFSSLYNLLHPFFEVTIDEELDKIIQEIQPDVIHSFEMQSCSYPILKTMNNYPNIKWIYSCWGSDLFYYQNDKVHYSKIIRVLDRVNFLHTDCQRDFIIAKSLGFKGEHLGVIPGGTGYEIPKLEKYKKNLNERKIILVKGYQHHFGRGLVIVEALKEIQSFLGNYEVVVFGAHPAVIGYIKQNELPFKVYDRHGLKHVELLKLMGESLIYIGNSISDGMSNTLLESIVMGAFPIQSNPGGVSEEIIDNGINGLLIENPENPEEIKGLFLQALFDKERLYTAYKHNGEISINRFDYEFNKQKVIALYNNVKEQIAQ